MLALFVNIQDHIPIGKKIGVPRPEGLIARLNYRATAMILILCCLLNTCSEWIANGGLIQCMTSDKDSIPENVINNYCYIMSTFVIPKHWKGLVSQEIIAAGVGPYNPETDDVEYKQYYQWVPFVLFLQAILFYIPHLIFKVFEGGKIKKIITGLNKFIVHKNERVHKEKELAKYFASTINTHNFWAIKLLLCELLYLLNVIGNLFFTDDFLDKEFSTYGIDVLDFINADPEERVDPMAVIFPRLTKCNFHKFGPSGTIQNHDAVCVLGINIINEKIYIFLWFWFILVASLSALNLLYHLIIFLIPSILSYFIDKKARYSVPKVYFDMDIISENFGVGDWKLLYHLSKNMDSICFNEFLHELTMHLKNGDNGTAKKPLK